MQHSCKLKARRCGFTKLCTKGKLQIRTSTQLLYHNHHQIIVTYPYLFQQASNLPFSSYIFQAIRRTPYNALTAKNRCDSQLRTTKTSLVILGVSKMLKFENATIYQLTKVNSPSKIISSIESPKLCMAA